MAQQTCEVCSNDLVFRWTDTHGVGVCCKCGAPYTIYHYENDKRVERPPVLALTSKGASIARRYWTEKQRRVFPGAFDMGFSGSRRDETYSGATNADIVAFNQWCATQPETEKLPAEKAVV